MEDMAEEGKAFIRESLAIDPLYLGLLWRADRANFDRATGGRIEEALNVAYVRKNAEHFDLMI